MPVPQADDAPSPVLKRAKSLRRTFASTPRAGAKLTDLAPIPGTVPDLRGDPPPCRYRAQRFPIRGTERSLHAVDDVSFTIARGESVGLVGESGCSKSTLVRLITRLLDPTDGRIVFDGCDVGAIPPARFTHTPERRLIQMVFQDPSSTGRRILTRAAVA